MANELPFDPEVSNEIPQNDAGGPSEPTQRRRGRQPGSTNKLADQAKNAPPADPSAVQRALYGIFNGIAKLTRSSATFDMGEFKELSGELCDFGKKVPPLNLVLNALQPVTIGTHIVDKAVSIRQGMPAKQQEQAVKDGVHPYVPDYTPPQ